MSKKSASPPSDEEVLKQIQDFYRFMQDNRLEALEWSQENFQIKLIRQRSVPVTLPPSSTTLPPVASQPSGDSLPAGAQAIRSPLMGIFYRAPSPSSPPFVKEGDIVKAGQVLCVVEAMKVFNEIKAEFDAKILKILVDNGRPIKANQELFFMEKQ